MKNSCGSKGCRIIILPRDKRIKIIIKRNDNFKSRPINRSLFQQ